jgi:C1A family cysteine protease
VPRPIDLRHLDRLPVTAASRLQNEATAGAQATASGTQANTATANLPATFDWRTQGKVTPVRNQSSCGTCWAFGTMAAFESRTWIQAGSQNDFSEQNLVCCSDPAWTYLTGRRCGAGGWDFIAVDTLIKKGARLESCDPYNTSTISTAVCQGCATSYRATGFRTVCYSAAGNEAAIKDAIYNYGPVEAAFYYSGSTVYNGYIIHQPGGAYSRNHLICIVGWDDTFSYGGTTGTWIIKNSWGASSGQGGYYYMTYGSSNLGDVGYFSSVSAVDPTETLYSYDEAGIVSAFGYGGASAWMASVFTTSQAGRLTAADFWTTSSNAQYTVNIYSGQFGSLLATQSGTWPSSSPRWGTTIPCPWSVPGAHTAIPPSRPASASPNVTTGTPGPTLALPMQQSITPV